MCEDDIKGSKVNMILGIYTFLWNFINGKDPVEVKA